MADDVVVEVKNRVPRTIKRDFDEIGNSANTAQDRVDRFQRVLDRLARDGTRHMQTLALAEGRLARNVAATAVAQDRAAVSALRLSQARLRASQASERAARSEARGGGLGRFAGSVAGGGGFRGAAMSSVGSGAASAAASNPYVAAAVIGTAAVAGAAATHIKFADDYAGLNNILQTVTGNLDLNGTKMRQLSQIANDTQKPIGAVVEGYARFDRTLSDLGKTQDESLQFTDTLNQMLFRYGKTGSEAESVTRQLTQAMGKGKLDGDEFRSVMENLPELGKALAEQLGVTRGELLELAPQGKITADVIFNAMQRAKTTIDGMPEPVLRLDGALNKITNSATIWFGELEKSNGIAMGFIRTLSSLGDVLDRLADKRMQLNRLQDAGKLGTVQGLRDYLKLSEEASKDKSVTTALENAADAFQEYNLQRKAGLSTAEAQGERALHLLDKVLGKSNEVDAATKDRIANINKEVDSRATLERIYEEQLKKAERELELAKMSKAQRDAAEDADAASAKFRKEGVEFADLEIGKQNKLKKLWQEIASLQNRKEDKTEEKRELVLAKINAQLDNELSRLSMLQPARENQEKLDRIQEGLITKKIDLTDSETSSIRQRIAAIQDATMLQREYEAVLLDSNGAHEQFGLITHANALALATGAITQERHTQNMAAALEVYLRSIDPLRQESEARKEEIALLGMASRAREIEAQVRDTQNQLIERSRGLNAEGIDQLREELIAHRDRTESLKAMSDMIDAVTESQRKLNLESQTYLATRGELRALGVDATTRLQVANDNGADISGTRTAFEAEAEAREAAYARIDEMRRLDILNEREASIAKTRIWQQEQQSKLSLAETFFSQFIGLQRSENKEIAAIGKAAAIANATVQTYSAAVAAYAAMAGIPVVGPALGATAAAAAIASGIINIGQIAAAPTGFRQGGYTGDVPSSRVAGVVHGQEYVFDAANTRRLGRGNLEALRTGGALASNDNGSPMQLNLTLIVVGSEQEAHQEAAKEQVQTAVLNTIAAKRSTVRMMVNG